jgi:starch synthase
MNILMAASELAPLVRAGGLGDAVAELSGELQLLGHEVSVVLPYYRTIREDKTIKARKTGVKFSVSVGSGRYPCEIFEHKTANGVQVFLVSRDEYFDRSGLYGVDGRDYQDNAARFIFFTKCVLELARRVEPAPSVLHLHSWETSLAPVFVRDQGLPFRTVLTPHGLEFQGNFWSYDFGLTNLPGEYFSARGVEYFGSMNCLKGGILDAHAVVLPGERFVAAAQTPLHGCGLDAVLREHQHKLHGIPSTAGVQGWNPESDSALTAKFSIKNLGARAKNRIPFLEAAGLNAGNPLAVYVAFTEATQDAGLDIFFASLDRLFVEDVRVALFGPVPEEHTIALEVAKRKHQGRFVHWEKFEESLARQALAGTDLFVLPGPVEPEIIWLKRALCYGAVPVAARCGGLFQSVLDWDQDGGNGFVFAFATVTGLLDACRHAARKIEDPQFAEKLRLASMGRDFSPTAAARRHVALYENLTGTAGLTRAA